MYKISFQNSYFFGYTKMINKIKFQVSENVYCSPTQIHQFVIFEQSNFDRILDCSFTHLRSYHYLQLGFFPNFLEIQNARIWTFQNTSSLEFDLIFVKMTDDSSNRHTNNYGPLVSYPAAQIFLEFDSTQVPCSTKYFLLAHPFLH